MCVGKLKKKYWSDGVAEYAKRLGVYAVCGWMELSRKVQFENTLMKKSHC